MPTSYTATIEKGISFPEFAMNCARNFGALISMRDDPMDTEIPDEFPPDEYYKNKIIHLESEIKELEKKSLPELDSLMLNEFNNEVKSLKQYIEKDSSLLQKYESMLAKVEQWNPPTVDHEELKNFMISQIWDSIKFDCNQNYWEEKLKNKLDNKPTHAEQWRENKLNVFQEGLFRCKKEWRKEQKRATERTEWVRQLKKSLITYCGKGHEE